MVNVVCKVAVTCLSVIFKITFHVVTGSASGTTGTRVTSPGTTPVTSPETIRTTLEPFGIVVVPAGITKSPLTFSICLVFAGLFGDVFFLIGT